MTQTELMNLYDAVLNDNGAEIKKILNESLLTQSKISTRTITGLLVIAVENKLISSTKAILDYNNNSSQKISDLHYNAIICLAAKSNFLDKLQITLH